MNLTKPMDIKFPHVSVKKFPHVSVKLADEDGNAFSILTRVSSAMRNNGVSEEDIETYRKESTEGDYDHLLRVTMQTVNVS